MLGRHSKPFLQIAGTLLVLLLSQSATAQQITVKLVDGRNGHALKNQSIGLWLGDRAIGNPAITRITSSDGSAVFPVPHEQQSFVIAKSHRDTMTKMQVKMTQWCRLRLQLEKQANRTVIR